MATECRAIKLKKRWGGWGALAVAGGKGVLYIVLVIVPDFRKSDYNRYYVQYRGQEAGVAQRLIAFSAIIWAAPSRENTHYFYFTFERIITTFEKKK